VFAPKKTRHGGSDRETNGSLRQADTGAALQPGPKRSAVESFVWSPPLPLARQIRPSPDETTSALGARRAEHGQSDPDGPPGAGPIVPR
jgi:hypothetical protein